MQNVRKGRQCHIANMFTSLFFYVGATYNYENFLVQESTELCEEVMRVYGVIYKRLEVSQTCKSTYLYTYICLYVCVCVCGGGGGCMCVCLVHTFP